MSNSQEYKSKYSAVFATAALLYPEICAVLPILKGVVGAEVLDQDVKENKFLKIKSEAGRRNTVAEIKRRAKTVDASFWHFFEERSEQEQRLALLYLVLKTYALVHDFHFEVVLQKWKSLDFNVEKFDLQMRLDEISSSDEEVARWSDSTRNKLQTVYLRMLREAGLLGRTRLRKPENIDSSFWEYFIAAGAPWFLEACFLSKTEREAYL